MAIKQIAVTSDAQGNPGVNIEDLDIWSTEGDQVHWTGSAMFIIDFQGNSPFASSVFSNGEMGVGASSGPIKAGATGSYKYNVKIGSKTLDPIVKVHP